MQKLVGATAVAAVWLLSLAASSMALTEGADTVWQMPVGDGAIVVWGENRHAEAQWFTFFWGNGRITNPSPSADARNSGLEADIVRLRDRNMKLMARLGTMLRNTLLGTVSARIGVNLSPGRSAAALKS